MEAPRRGGHGAARPSAHPRVRRRRDDRPGRQPVGPRALGRRLERRIGAPRSPRAWSPPPRAPTPPARSAFRPPAAGRRRSSRPAGASRSRESCRCRGASTTPGRWRARSPTAGCCSRRWRAPTAGWRRRRSMLLCPMRCPSAQRRGRSRACGWPSPRAPASVELEADVAAGFELALETCRRLGASLVEPPAPAAGFDVGDDFLDVLTTEMVVYHRRFDGRRDRYRPSLREWVEEGERRAVSGEAYVAAHARRRELTGGLGGLAGRARHHRGDRAHDPGRRAAARGGLRALRAPTTR